MSVNPVAAIAAGAGSASLVPGASNASIAADVASPRTFDVTPPGLVQSTLESTAGGGAFESMLTAVRALNDRLLASDQAVRGLALGNVENLHQTMMSLEQARLSLQLLLQVRNGALDAYQQLMRMQI